MKLIRQLCILGLLLGGLASPLQALSDYERKIVASVLVLEAGSYGTEGMRAVLNVIHNRADRSMDRVIPVVVRKKQFSSINHVTGKRTPDYGPILRKALKQHNFNTAYQLVREMERGELVDTTYGATHYYAVDIKPPYWSKEMTYLTTIGGHHFFLNDEVEAQASSN